MASRSRHLALNIGKDYQNDSAGLKTGNGRAVDFHMGLAGETSARGRECAIITVVNYVAQRKKRLGTKYPFITFGHFANPAITAWRI